MAEIRFSADKTERWLERIEKRLASLSPEDVDLYKQLRTVHNAGNKLDSQQAKALWTLGKKL
jgi:hypothetical protein